MIFAPQLVLLGVLVRSTPTRPRVFCRTLRHSTEVHEQACGLRWQRENHGAKDEDGPVRGGIGTKLQRVYDQNMRLKQVGSCRVASGRVAIGRVASGEWPEPSAIGLHNHSLTPGGTAPGDLLALHCFSFFFRQAQSHPNVI